MLKTHVGDVRYRALLSLVFVAQRHNQHINWDIVNQLARR